MRARLLIAATALSLTAAPAPAQDFLGRLAQSTAESAAQRLVNGAVSSATRPRSSAPPAGARNVQPRTAPTPNAGPAQNAAPASEDPRDTIVLRNGMPVLSSDGVRVAETIHIYDAAYVGDHSFFTTDTTYRLRRIYPREAEVRGGSVHLRMTAAQYRARSQNPEHFPG